MQIFCCSYLVQEKEWSNTGDFFLDRILCELSSLSSYSIALGVVLNLQDRNVASKNPAVRTQTIGKQVRFVWNESSKMMEDSEMIHRMSHFDRFSTIPDDHHHTGFSTACFRILGWLSCHDAWI